MAVDAWAKFVLFPKWGKYVIFGPKFNIFEISLNLFIRFSEIVADDQRQKVGKSVCVSFLRKTVIIPKCYNHEIG